MTPSARPHVAVVPATGCAAALSAITGPLAINALLLPDLSPGTLDLGCSCGGKGEEGGGAAASWSRERAMRAPAVLRGLKRHVNC